MRVWVTPRYSKTAPEPWELAEKPKGNTLHRADGWTYVNWYREGETWHRKYPDAVQAARRHRAAWLAELTTKAAEVASLPSMPESQHDH